ncbi:MAG: DegV family protein [Clostridia bacterium]|nr:DegV family protein [Clostridia bacterium]
MKDQQVVGLLFFIELAPKITALAVPESLDYLRRGGRLSASGWAVGTLLRIKPIIMLKGGVSVYTKTIGMPSAKKVLLRALDNCDTNYPIVPSFTYKSDNLDLLLDKTEKEYKDIMLEKDNLDHAIACHWGPNAFGFVFVERE